MPSLDLTLRLIGALAWLLIASVASTASTALESARVRIVDTWPAGDDIELPRGHSLYLRLAYESDTPIRIWARPFYRGEPVSAGTNPSFLHHGTGETLAWFFLMEAGRVDEIRISIGSPDSGTQYVAAVWRGRIIEADPTAAAASPAPAWVADLRAQEKALQRQAYEARMNQPVTARDSALAAGFGWATLLLGIAGIAAPILAARAWQGGWRLVACVPAVVMALVILNIILDVMLDPTAHNLWPFEILMAGLASLAAVAVLFLIRKVRSA